MQQSVYRNQAHHHLLLYPHLYQPLHPAIKITNYALFNIKLDSLYLRQFLTQSSKL